MRDAEAFSVRAETSRDNLERYLQIDLMRIFSWLRAGLKWIVLFTLAGLLLGAAFSMLANPRYTVTTDILINPAGLQVVADDLFRQDEQQRDSALLNIESKRQTLVSRSVLLKVVESLGLDSDPEFVPPPSWTSRFRPGALAGGSSRPALAPEIIALSNLEQRVSARRDEVSFVVTLSVWTNSPEKSIRISEEMVTIFKADLIEADSEGARRMADALTDRIMELKTEVAMAEREVEDFRREHGLQSSQGELISSRSMSQINQQLVDARERLIEARSRYDDLISSNSDDAAAIQSPTVSSLRTQYALLKSRLDADSQRFGPRHPRIAQQQTELRTLRDEIEAERSRMVRAAQNNLNQAMAVVAALETDASTVSSEVFVDNDAQVRLRDLTREATAKTAIYEAFLVRARQITERQDLDTTNIRVISPPVPPRSRSWPPRTVQVAGFGAIVGLVLGVLGVLGQGVWRDMTRLGSRPSTARGEAADRENNSLLKYPRD